MPSNSGPLEDVAKIENKEETTVSRNPRPASSEKAEGEEKVEEREGDF